MNAEAKPGNGLSAQSPAIPVTLTPLYKVLCSQLSPRIEAYILSHYLRRSGGKLPSAARAGDLSDKAQMLMKRTIERAYDLKQPSDQVVPGVLQAITELLDLELDGDFGVNSA